MHMVTRQSPPDLRVEGMSKHFGQVIALSDAALHLTPGSFHALLGENGAGKSTLVKCVMGYHQPDKGRLLIEGKARKITSPMNAQMLGIGMVYQHFTLVPNMTVEENLLLARSDIPHVINWRREKERMNEFLRGVPFRLELNATAGSLAAGEKQKIEIIKQLYLNAQILILDEPTSVLTPEEADEILGHLRDMAQEKKLSVLFISHKLREVLQFADRVTVLRHGRTVGEGEVKGLSTEDLTEMMVGSHEFPVQAARTVASARDARLEVLELSVENDKGIRALDDISLVVSGGEILGVAGVSGNGQRELVQVLAGQRAPLTGEMRIRGQSYTATREQMRRFRFSCLPEEPLSNACVGRMTVAENLAFRVFDRPPFTVGGAFVSPRRMRSQARRLISRFSIKTDGQGAKAETLSGGNVQRLVLARELSSDVEVLVVANPCFGLDVKAIAEIRGKIVEARNRGAAVLLVSEDLDEIFELADRIVVMSEGRIVLETTAALADRGTIGHAMTGQIDDVPPATAALPLT